MLALDYTTELVLESDLSAPTGIFARGRTAITIIVREEIVVTAGAVDLFLFLGKALSLAVLSVVLLGDPVGALSSWGWYTGVARHYSGCGGVLCLRHAFYGSCLSSIVFFK